MNTITCPSCKAQVLSAAFCDNCGASLSTVASTQVEAVPGICPNCHAVVQVDDLFCDNCGHDLLPASGFPESPQRPAEEPVEPSFASARSKPEYANVEGDIVLRGEHIPETAAAAAPRLLVQPVGTVLTLSPDKETYVIGREDPASDSYPDVDLVPFGGEEGGVSRRHARIIRDGRQFFIEDLNSVNYTFVNKQKIPEGAAHPIYDGDEIRLGRVLLRFKTG